MTLLSIFNIGESAYDCLEIALEIWENAFDKIVDILTQSPNEMFNGAAWTYIENIMGAFVSIAYMLVILFFYMGMIHSTTSFMENKRLVYVFKSILRFALTIWAVKNSPKLCIYIFKLFALTISEAFDVAGATGTTLPEMSTALKAAIENASFWQQVICMLISFIAMLVILVVVGKIFLTVYGRVIKILVYCVVAPFGMATFAGETTQRNGGAFIRAFLSVCMEGLLIAVCCIVFNVVADSISTTVTGQTGEPVYTVTRVEDSETIPISTTNGITTYSVTATYNIKRTDAVPNPSALEAMENVKDKWSQYYVSTSSDGTMKYTVTETTSNPNGNITTGTNLVNDFKAITDIGDDAEGAVTAMAKYSFKIAMMLMILYATIGACDMMASRMFGL
jgi:hypothetical protein